MIEIEPHPAAEAFPMMAPGRYAELLASIRESGQRVPIVVCDGRVLDGRNRAKACAELGIEPESIPFDGGDPWAYVWDLNGARRDLEPGQRAAIRLRINQGSEAWRREQAERREAANRARSEAQQGRPWVPEGGTRESPVSRDTAPSRDDRARQQLAADAGVSEATAGRVMSLNGKRPDLVAQVADGDLTLADARREAVAPPESKLRIHHSSEASGHYTPDLVLELVMQALGDIDLDPCADPDGRVCARAHYTAEDDGLSREWHGRVFMNPPYGRGIQDWAEKLRAEHEAGRVTAAITLMPARTDTAWWRVLEDFPVCFWRGRLTFIGNADPAPFPSALHYLGDDIERFARVFSEYGRTWRAL